MHTRPLTRVRTYTLWLHLARYNAELHLEQLCRTLLIRLNATSFLKMLVEAAHYLRVVYQRSFQHRHDFGVSNMPPKYCDRIWVGAGPQVLRQGGACLQAEALFQQFKSKKEALQGKSAASVVAKYGNAAAPPSDEALLLGQSENYVEYNAQAGPRLIFTSVYKRGGTQFVQAEAADIPPVLTPAECLPMYILTHRSTSYCNYHTDTSAGHPNDEDACQGITSSFTC